MWNPSDFESDDLDGFGLELNDLETELEPMDDYDDTWDEVNYDPYSGSYEYETDDWYDEQW